MKKLFLLLLLAATTCFAQQMIVGDPTEPCGPVRPDYWLGRKTNPFPRGEEPALSKAKEDYERKWAGVRSETKAAFSPKAALTDSYAFGSNVRVNDDTPGWFFATPYSSGGHAMAARGDTVYLVWRDDRTGTSTIFFDKSADGGNTWGTDVKVNDGDSGAVMPALALGKDGTIYVSWTDFRHITRQIYFAKSTDGGNTFTPGVHVQPATPDKQQFSSIAVNDSGYIFIAYEDFRNIATTAIDIYCSRSIDGGSSFDTAVRVDDCVDSIDQWHPCIAVNDSNVFISWTDFRNTNMVDLYADIYLSKSTDVGQNYLLNVLVNDTAGQVNTTQWNSSIAIDSNNLYICWQDDRNGDYHIYITKSIDIGQSFTTPNKNIIDAVGQAYAQGYPTLTCDDSGGVYCAWERPIYFSFSKNHGDTFSTNNYLVNDPNMPMGYEVYAPVLCCNKKGKVFCAWEDNRDNLYGIATDIYATGGTYVGVAGEPPQNMYNKLVNIYTYPNPFKQKVKINYQLQKRTYVVLRIYNINGQLIKNMINADQHIGDHYAMWDGTDNDNNKITGGIYIVKFNCGNQTINKKIILIR